MVQAQRQNSTLPAKLTEMVLHPQALSLSQKPYPFMTLPSDAVQENYKQNTPSPKTSIQSTPTKIDSTHIGAGLSSAAQGNSMQIESTQDKATQINQENQALDRILRNKSGQRIDSRVDGLGWLVRDARPRNICYEHHLHGQCRSTTPCPWVHVTSALNIHQLNALQVLAREVPCGQGNCCADWKCCYGHRCPFSEKCNKGDRCRFSATMHFTDLKVVNQRWPR